MDRIGIEAAGRHHLLHFRHADLRRRRHGLVEIARRLAEDEVAALVGLPALDDRHIGEDRSEEHTSELQSLMRISYAVFCLKKKNTNRPLQHTRTSIYINQPKQNI